LSVHPDLLRRTSESGRYSEGTSSLSGFSANQQNNSIDLTNNIGTGSYATGKGSRLAKFFDGKARDGPTQVPPMGKAQTPIGMQSSSPVSSQRQEASGFNGVIGVNNDNRGMDDAFDVIINPTQVSDFFGGYHPVNDKMTYTLYFQGSAGHHD
jgi:zinc finger CCCH domain-containing protein 13